MKLNSDALHDLMGPVNQMRAMADLILRRYKGQLDADAEVLFGFMQNSSERLQTLLTGLRTYTRIVGQHQPYRRFLADEVLDGALATIEPAIIETDALVTHDPLPELYGNPNQIGYVFASLIDNAIKFRSESRPQIHIAALAQDNGWLFSVCDNGIGIDPKYSDRVFGVFKRIHQGEYPGAGMGLAIADRIVERHGGSIWVESHAGQGSTFYFAIPDVADGASSPQANS